MKRALPSTLRTAMATLLAAVPVLVHAVPDMLERAWLALTVCGANTAEGVKLFVDGSAASALEAGKQARDEGAR